MLMLFIDFSGMESNNCSVFLGIECGCCSKHLSPYAHAGAFVFSCGRLCRDRKGFRSGAKQKIVDQLRIGLSERVERAGPSEKDWASRLRPGPGSCGNRLQWPTLKIFMPGFQFSSVWYISCRYLSCLFHP